MFMSLGTSTLQRMRVRRRIKNVDLHYLYTPPFICFLKCLLLHVWFFFCWIFMQFSNFVYQIRDFKLNFLLIWVDSRLFSISQIVCCHFAVQKLVYVFFMTVKVLKYALCAAQFSLCPSSIFMTVCYHSLSTYVPPPWSPQGMLQIVDPLNALKERLNANILLCTLSLM